MRALLIALLSAQALTGPVTLPAPKDFARLDSSLRMVQLRAETVARADSAMAVRPHTVQTLAAQLEASARDAALQVARELADGEPAEVAEVLRLLSEGGFTFTQSDAKVYGPRLNAIVDAIKARLKEWPKETAAQAAYRLLSLELSLGSRDPAARAQAYGEFARTYAGTPEADELGVRQVERGRDPAPYPAALRALARKHARTVAGAAALYQLGFDIGHNPPALDRNPDPTDRFLQVVEIVKELESGEFPACEWVRRAPELVVEFFAPSPVRYAAENLPRMYAAYKAFVRAHPGGIASRSPTDDSLAWIVKSGVARLPADAKDAAPLAETFLAELAAEAADPDVFRFALAEFYMSVLGDNSMLELPVEQDWLAARARAILEPLSARPASAYQRKATATLAALDFFEGRYREARDGYQRFLVRFPDSDWAWAAAVCIGESSEALGEHAAAAAAYEAAAERFAHMPFVVVLARTAAAQVREANQQFAPAAVNYQGALKAWDPRVEPYSWYSPQSDRLAAQGDRVRGQTLQKADLIQRLDLLAKAAGAPGGLQLEQGRLALEAGRPREAAALFRRVIDEHAASTIAPEARKLWRRSRLESAMTLANRQSAGPRQDDEALGEIESLIGEPYDVFTSIARLAKSALLLRRGAQADADALAGAAFKEWHARQALVPAPATDVERDVAEIRALLFRPDRGGPFAQPDWRFEWPFSGPLPPFLVTSPMVRVELPGREPSQVSVRFTPLVTGNLLFVAPEEFRLVIKVLETLGGTETRTPTRVMDVPNQPVGDVRAIAALWGKYFHLRPGHWAGWDLGSVPWVTNIAFEPGGLKASVRITVGYTGGTVLLEKENGRWVAKALVERWIT